MPLLWLWELDLSVTDVVGEGAAKAWFGVSSTRWGVVAKESTRTAV